MLIVVERVDVFVVFVLILVTLRFDCETPTLGDSKTRTEPTRNLIGRVGECSHAESLEHDCAKVRGCFVNSGGGDGSSDAEAKSKDVRSLPPCMRPVTALKTTGVRGTGVLGTLRNRRPVSVGSAVCSSKDGVGGNVRLGEVACANAETSGDGGNACPRVRDERGYKDSDVAVTASEDHNAARHGAK